MAISRSMVMRFRPRLENLVTGSGTSRARASHASRSTWVPARIPTSAWIRSLSRSPAHRKKHEPETRKRRAIEALRFFVMDGDEESKLLAAISLESGHLRDNVLATCL